MPVLPVGDPEPQTLDEILDWHRGVVDALTEQRVSVQMAIRTGQATAPRFIGMTEAEVDHHYDAQRRELYRHWLGHGRYWDKPVEVDQLDPDEVYDRANALLQALPA